MWPERFRTALGIALGLSLSAAAWGQTPAPNPAPPASPAPPSSAPPPSNPPPAPSKEGLRECNAAENICVTAAQLEVPEKGHTKLRGFVDIQFGASRIQADQVDLYEMEKADGTTAKRLVAEGNVVFMSGEERLAGERLEMELDTSRGTFDNASGFVSPGVLVEAKKIERIDADTYRIEDGRFTSCTQPNPRWRFSASSATLEVDDKVKAKNVVFKVKGVPAFYMPYFVYPIQQDQRSTGILFPHFGSSQVRGFNVGGGFFWAMGRSYDQTFYLDHYSKFGWGLGHELRYMLPQPSRGTFRTYFFRRTQGGAAVWEHDFNWNAMQMLPGKVRASLMVQESSTVDFQEQFQDSLDLASRRSRFWTLSLQRGFGPHLAQFLADSTDTVFYDPFDSNPRFDTRRHWPSFTLSESPRKLKHGAGIVFGYEARAEGLEIGNQDARNRYTRFDLNPRVSRPLSKPFLQLNPQVQLRYTQYEKRIDSSGDFVAEPLARKYLETGLEMRGPSLSRVFNTPGNFYSDRYKHVITPEVTYTYRSKVEEFELIPRFDYLDFLPGTNEVRYGLTQQLYAKRPGKSGKTEPYEFLNWRVSQTYYVDIAKGQNEFDPNYSSLIFGPGGTPAHYSPLQSRLRFRPTPRVSNNFDVEYDTNFHELRSLSLSTTVNYNRLSLDGRYYKGRFRSGDRVAERDTLRGSARLQLVPDKLTLSGSAAYDVTTKNMVQSTARLRYDVQCCGFVVDMIQSDYNLNSDRRFTFSIELANIGSIGNFMGQDASDQNRRFLTGR